jgi:hypothetical protein
LIRNDVLDGKKSVGCVHPLRTIRTAAARASAWVRQSPTSRESSAMTPPPVGAAATGASKPVAAIELRRRRNASRAAAGIALTVFIIAAAFTIGRGITAPDPTGGLINKDTTETTQSGDQITTKTTTSVEETSPGTDQSLVGRAFAGSAAPILFQFLLTGLAAFASGALVQRIWLGEYGISVGPVTIPALPEISGETAAKAVDLITESPEFASILGPGPRRPQPHPQFQSIADERLSLLGVRIELEHRLRELGSAVGLDRDILISKLPSRLSQEGLFDESAARGLAQLVDIGDRIAEGATLDAQAETQLRERAFSVLYALSELRQRALEQRRRGK